MSPALLAAVLTLSAAPADGAPASAPRQGPLDAAETRALLRRLVRYVQDHHLKSDPKSPQRGMVYEYFAPARQGKVDQWVQGEALDTMHDGAWLAAALVSAVRATGDPACKALLTRQILPFYCKMLNHSDTLFSARRDDSRPGGHRFNKEHALQEGEKGFVPYWWDDGASVSLERMRDKNPLGPFSCTDLLAGKPNPDYRLVGWSHGSSNHLAQDLGVMLQTSWLYLRNSPDADDRKLAAEVAEAAKNLHECRMRHHGHIPMCDASAALAAGDARLLRHVPDVSGEAAGQPANHAWRALYDFKPTMRTHTPGFADDQQYRYYAGLARHAGRLPDALAFRTVYDAFTEPMLYRLYCDDEPPLPGINRFDLHPYTFRDGRPEDFRSERKGPHRRPRPIGSRMGPQNMVCCGLALQLLAERPGLWLSRMKRLYPADVHLPIDEPALRAGAAAVAPASLRLAGTTLRLRGTGNTLEISGETPADRVVLELFARPDAAGASARLTIPATGAITAVNERGQPLTVLGLARDAGEGRGFAFTLRLPCTAHVRQTAAWANLVEHGRYSLRCGKETVNLFAASPEAQVTAWLRRELGEGLRTWQTIFDDKGYIPTGSGAGDWDRFSDSGGYAHLIAAAAQWLFVLEGKRDWDGLNVPELLPAKRAAEAGR